MLLPTAALVRRIEAAEVATLAAVIDASRSGWVCPLAGGAALFRNPGSPFTKVAGVGFAPLSAAELVAVERRYAAERAVVQFELATLADPEPTNLLAERGYAFTGYEQVLGRALVHSRTLHRADEVTVCPAREHERDAWVEVLTAGALVPASGEEFATHDTFETMEVERALRDMANTPDVLHWLARLDGAVAGAAGMVLRDGIAQLSGAATRPAVRRRGVQAALLAARLEAARDAGCELAVLTTQPGSQSQHNAQRAGFEPLYLRAIWRREAAVAAEG